MSVAANALWQQIGGGMPDEAAKGLQVRFELRPDMDQTKTDDEGRPVFVDAEFVEIRSQNDPLCIIERKVEPKDRVLYAQLYRAFKEGAAEVLTGTPLKEWAVIAKSQSDYLTFKGIRTVEQFADVSDDGCQHLGHGYLTLRNKAIAWLAQAKDSAQVVKMAAELQKRDVQIQSQQRQISELVSRLDSLGTEAPAAAPKSKKG